MRHYHSLDEITLPDSWVTIGSFDGVHKGHQAILDGLVEQAHAENTLAVVLTFFPHPAVVLRGLTGPYYLTSPEERANLLAAIGVDIIITNEFTKQTALLSAKEFMEKLCGRLGLRQLWAGYDFALGRGREGDVLFLQQLGKELGYTVHVIPPVTLSDDIISSSQVRQFLTKGDVSGAARLLGRNYTISGKVVQGDGRGRGLGIPTANLQVWPLKLLPASGVYATWTWLGEQRIPSITNVGVRPTFENQPVAPRVETHILNFDQDIYGSELRLEFLSFLRSEQRFTSIQALMDQIQKDIRKAQEILA